MKTNLSTCLEFTLAQEGGWSDDPNDPGGCTNQGITLSTYRLFTGNPDAGPDDLRAMTATTRDTIYVTRYWALVHGDDLLGGIDLMVFDMAVNAGTGRSARLLQQVLGFTGWALDGDIGPKTCAAIAGANLPMLVTMLGDAQADYYRSLAEFDRYGAGWLARVWRRVTRAKEMASNTNRTENPSVLSTTQEQTP
jgi:lysozyme family protein